MVYFIRNVGHWICVHFTLIAHPDSWPNKPMNKPVGWLISGIIARPYSQIVKKFSRDLADRAARAPHAVNDPMPPRRGIDSWHGAGDTVTQAV